MHCFLFVIFSEPKLPSFDQWKEGHPNFSKGACVTLTAKGQWKMSDCDRRLAVICSLNGKPVDI